MARSIAIAARRVPPEYGGGGLLAVSLAKELSRRGFAVTVLTDTPTPAGIAGCRVLSPHVLPATGLLGKSVAKCWESIWLWRVILRGDFDLVYGVSAQYFTLTAVRIAKWLKIPCAFETSLLGGDDYLSVRQRPLGLLQGSFFLAADRIVNISPALEEAACDAKVPAEKLLLIPNLVDETRFCTVDARAKAQLRARLGVAPEVVLAFSAGSVSRRKGYDRLVDAFLDIGNDCPEAVLALAGPVGQERGSQLLRDSLERRLSTAGLSHRVLWLGHVSNVDEWMKAADLFLFGSRREGFGTVLTEAMAVGLPIVAFQLDGITDFVVGNESGGIIVNDRNEFVKTWRGLVESVDSRRRLGRLMRRRYSRVFSAESVMKRYIQLFADLGVGETPAISPKGESNPKQNTEARFGDT
jgi:L-malate glycosyltransferase